MSNKSKQLKNDLAKLVNKPEKGTGESGNVLAKLFRQALWDNGITPAVLEELINQYEERDKLAKGNPQKKENQMKMSRQRSARIRAVAQDKITWRVFKRGLELIGVKKFTLVLAIKDTLGVIKKVSIGSSAPLADLFESVLEVWDVTPYQFRLRLDEWWDRDDQKAVIESNNGRKPAGNLKRGLVSESMTWPFFMKGLRVLRFESVSFQLNIHHWDGIISSHEIHEVLDEDNKE